MGIRPLSSTVVLGILLLAMVGSSTQQVEYSSDDDGESSRAEPLFQLDGDGDEDLRSEQHSRFMGSSKPRPEDAKSSGYKGDRDGVYYSPKFGYFSTSKPPTPGPVQHQQVIKHVVHYPDGSTYELASDGTLKPIALSAGAWTPQNSGSSSSPFVGINMPGQRPGYAPGYANYAPGSANWNDGTMDYSKYPPVLIPQSVNPAGVTPPQGYPNAPYAPSWQYGAGASFNTPPLGQYQNPTGWPYGGANANANYNQNPLGWSASGSQAPQIYLNNQLPYMGGPQNYSPFPTSPGLGYGGGNLNTNYPSVPNYSNYPQMYPNYPQSPNAPMYPQWSSYGQYPQGQYSPMGSPYWQPNGGAPFGQKKLKNQAKRQKLSSMTKDS